MTVYLMEPFPIYESDTKILQSILYVSPTT